MDRLLACLPLVGILHRGPLRQLAVAPVLDHLKLLANSVELHPIFLRHLKLARSARTGRIVHLRTDGIAETTDSSDLERKRY